MAHLFTNLCLVLGTGNLSSGVNQERDLYIGRVKVELLCYALSAKKKLVNVTPFEIGRQGISFGRAWALPKLRK